MGLLLADRVRESSTSTGAGAITLDGAPEGYATFASMGMGDYDMTYYTIVNTDNGEWETGAGFVDLGGAFQRVFVFYNSLGTEDFVAFTAGKKDVFVSLPSTIARAIPNYYPFSAPGALSKGDSRLLDDSGTYTLPPYGTGGIDEFPPIVRVRKTNGVTPTIQASSSDVIRTPSGDVSSVLFDIDAELVFSAGSDGVWEL